MKTILFIYSCDITDVRRGTPIRIAAMLRMLRSNSAFRVIAYDTRGKRLVQRLRELLQIPSDVVMGNAHTDLLTVACMRVLTRRKMVIDLHGLPEEERFLDGDISAFMRWRLRHWHRFLLRFVHLASVVCYGLEQDIASLVPKTVVVTSGIDECSLPSTSRAPLALHSPLRIAYIGNARKYQGISAVLDVGKRLVESGSSIQLTLVCSEPDRLQVMLREAFGAVTPSWINIVVNVPHAEAQQYMREADILLILRPDIPAVRCCFPAKIPEYLASGTTMIISTFSDVKRILTDQKDAYIVSANASVDESVTMIRELIQGVRAPIAPERALSTAKMLTWERVTVPLMNAILSL
jgi:glycosyltransferase involved in cell wall biosynthesis